MKYIEIIEEYWEKDIYCEAFENLIVRKGGEKKRGIDYSGANL
ncbi:MAG TPA: hypothetical protein VMU21_00915 [Thermodesulfovibrionales bacterium]|nr:hypothetical protein [Thermodesulfovibrionales bacterium]